MARYFLDSSALVKRYHHESGSADVEALFNAIGNRFFVSRLALVEVQSSLARLVREGVLGRPDFAALVARLEADVAARTLAVVAVSSRRLDGAAAVLGTHGLTHHVRTLDAIHLATAQALNSRSPLAAFVAADKRLLAVAGSACGFWCRHSEKPAGRTSPFFQDDSNAAAHGEFKGLGNFRRNGISSEPLTPSNESSARCGRFGRVR